MQPVNINQNEEHAMTKCDFCEFNSPKNKCQYGLVLLPKTHYCRKAIKKFEKYLRHAINNRETIDTNK